KFSRSVLASPPCSGIQNPSVRHPRFNAGSQKRCKRHRRRFFHAHFSLHFPAFDGSIRASPSIQAIENLAMRNLVVSLLTILLVTNMAFSQTKKKKADPDIGWQATGKNGAVCAGGSEAV